MLPTAVLDPRVDVREDVQKAHVVILGGNRYTQQTQSADSYNTTQCNFSFQPPSTNTIIDRVVRLRCKVKFTALGGGVFKRGTAANPAAVGDAPTQMPLASAMDVLDVAINGEHFSQNVGDYIHANLAYNNDAADRTQNWSTSPAMPDAFQSYDDSLTLGGARDPLQAWGNNSTEQTRGSFEPYNAVPSEAEPTELFYEFSEPLLISPLLTGRDNDEDEGLVNVNQISVSIRWKSDLSIMWSHAASPLGDPALTGVQVEFVTQPQLDLLYITPQDNRAIPDRMVLPYHRPQTYIKTQNSVSTGTQYSFISDTIKLNQVPRKMMLFVRRSRGSSDFKTPNSYCSIDHVNLNWDNQAGLLTNASPQQLYAISRRNGLNHSWMEWSKHRGSVFCCEFGTDVGLPRGLAPGVVTQATFQVEVRGKNLLPEATSDLEFFVLILLEGTFVVSTNFASASLGNVSVDNVLGASMGGSLNYHAYRKLSGGSFWSGMRSVIDAAHPAVSALHPLGGAVLKGAKCLMDQYDSPMAQPTGRKGGRARRMR